MRRFALFMLGAISVPAIASADPISRSEVMDRAQAYTYYLWRCGAENLTASCASDYESAYTPGDYMGVAYDWGGFDSLFEYDQSIADGDAAGSPAFGEVYSCTAGVDCSGFVSRAWGTRSKYGTSTLGSISSAISLGTILPGDAINKSGYHVVLYSDTLSSGMPVFYEAVGYNVHINVTGGYSYVDDFEPRRYEDITGTTVSTLAGTPTHPIDISTLPYADSRNTRDSRSDLFDGCAASPATRESGPEYVYKVTVTEPGQLTVSVADDVGVDIDVHLLTSPTTDACVARGDTTFTTPVDCGTYYIVADTFQSAGGTAYSGAYDLSVSLTPSGRSCGAGPIGYDPMGGPGDACSFAGDPSLPFCNPSLGADTCLSTSTTSFCSMPCETNTDCSSIEGRTCCGEIADGEFYCLVGDFCSSEADAGAPRSDAGAMRADSGATGLDAGARDGGLVHPDAAISRDSGATQALADSSVADVDASRVRFDTEQSPRRSKTPGCATSQRESSTGPSLLIALLGLALLRKRRLSRP